MQTQTSEFILDEEAVLKETLERTKFPFQPEEIISKAKDYFAAGVTDQAFDMLADDFVFIGPVVGPLTKAEFTKALSGFAITDGVPDLAPRFHHFRVDPLEGNRVWCTTYTKGTNTGSLMGMPATNKSFESPPEAISVSFNDEGKIIKYTIGHVMDRTKGTTGGLGGIYGILYGIGKPLPFPEANPWKKSRRYKLFQFIGSMVQRLKKD
eukprot:CAMPEP_0117753588 /NCGR_PEP_ID=MMETSP0947-20121206/12321_1 /TAXON_ID=44440 /ORGANISM="Chattonella subsalsa, Strain CCMP2191" /LENGTH=208 /DNA_ID=CAMNT_0005572511 /DNA_START=236 /DNA_END=862 /DNA_ORIENTATION=+